MEELEEPKIKEFEEYFGICTVILIAINVIVFLLTDLTHSSEDAEWLLQCGAMYEPYILEKGQYYRILTSMFLHFGLDHLFNNMLVLWFMGGTLEQRIGHVRYLIIYLLSGILAGTASLGYNIITGQTAISAGASGAIFGVVGGVTCFAILSRNQANGFTKRQMLVFIFLTFYSGFTSQGVDNVAHVAGFLTGLVLTFISCQLQKLFHKKQY